MKKVPLHKCPACGQSHDCARERAGIENDGPQDGDFTVCTSCGEIGVFNKDLSIRQATTADLIGAGKENIISLRRMQQEVQNAKLN